MALRNSLMKLSWCKTLMPLIKLSSNKRPEVYFSTSVESPGKVVFISQSTDIYDNLALEDWLYKNWDFRKRHLLLLWRNSPCVVMGRHQNPYVEANLPYLESAGVPVVRRSSGGGTVYHDFGNLNCSFFTPKEKYNRKMNLNTICKALKKDFDTDCIVNKKDDIIIKENLKISGTAAKLGRLTAYHHCTLLVSADKTQMKLTLQGDKSVQSKATSSVPSAVANLQDVCNDISVERLLASIGTEFLHSSEESKDDYRSSDGFTLINPSEDWFPGLNEHKQKLTSWEWLYGMTPLFEMTRPLPIPSSLHEGSFILISVEVYHGIIKNLKVKSSASAALKDLVERQIGSSFVGQRFSPDIFHQLGSQMIHQSSVEISSA